MSAPSSPGPPGSGPHFDDHANQPRRPNFDFRHLSKEEQLILQECNRESFWHRSVPFGLGLMGTTHFLVKAGYLKAHPRHGSLPKAISGMLIGYIIGKISYRAECNRKILARAPNGVLANAIRRYSSGLASEKSPFQAVPREEPSTPLPRDEMHSADFDTDKTPTQTPRGLDDSDRPTLDKEGFMPPSAEAVPVHKTYEDLRRENRQEFESKAVTRKSPSFERPWPPASLQRDAPQGRSSSSGQESDHGRSSWRRRKDTNKGGQKNQYGDEWDD